MRRIGIMLGILLVMAAMPAWAQSVSDSTSSSSSSSASSLFNYAQAQAEIAKRDLARTSELRQYLLAQIPSVPAAPAAPAAPPRPAPAARGANGVGAGVGNGIGVGTSTAFGTSVFTNNNRLTIVNRSDNPISSLQVGSGTWWNNPETVTLLGLTKDQQKKMDEIFQQHRIKLIDLNASLSKEEAILEPLIAADRLDEAKIVVQIDKIAQARAELEKDNSRLLLSLRQTLTMEQWTKVQAPANNRLRLRF